MKQSIRFKIEEFVLRNPGMTATGISHLLKKNPSTVSARLYELYEKGRVRRKSQTSMFKGKGKDGCAWRYY